MNAIELLKEDHARISRLFDEIEEAAGSSEKREVIEELIEKMELHLTIEEEVFYPSCAEHEELSDQADQALSEHQKIKDLLREMDLEAEDDELSEKVEELLGSFESHIDEEESELFSQVEDLYNAADLEQLGEEIEQSRRTRSEAA